MKAFISHQSALEFWRIQRVLPPDGAQRQFKVALSDNLPAIEQLVLPGLTLPLHIMLGKADLRRACQDMKQHVFTGKTPVGSFYSVDDTLFVSSPEFCFTQMANILPLVRLIDLGYELCGSYSMHTAGDPHTSARGFHLREPLTSKKKLEAFASRMPGVKGHQKTVRAMRYILEGSASPMETKLSMLLTLSYQLGGFGLPKPELNARIVPRKADRRITNKEFYICDLFWPDKGIAVEYNSNQFHTGSTHITDDAKKSNTLTAMGIRVIPVTAQQIFDNYEFERVARVIAKRLGKRLVYKNPGFAAAHDNLRDILNIESWWS